MGIVSLQLLTCIVPVTTLRLLNEILYLINNMLLEFKISITPYLMEVWVCTIHLCFHVPEVAQS